MADPTVPTQAAGASVSGGKEPEIHVMPEKYRGAALKAALPPVRTDRGAMPSSPTLPAASPLPRGPGAPGGEMPPPVGPTGPSKGLLIAGAAILLLLGVAAAVFFWPRPKPVSTPQAPKPTAKALNVNIAPRPLPATTTPVEPPPQPRYEPPRGPLPLAQDGDADGLTDIEEREIYATEAGSADTDADSYLDGGEVFFLYNPSGVAPVRLVDSGAVVLEEHAGEGFSVLRPKGWTVRDLPRGIVAVGETGEFVQVTVQANPRRTALVDWYLASAPGVSERDVVAFETRTGLSGIRGPDGLTSYIAEGDRIYVIAYGSAASREISYRRTYEMMVNGFKLPAAAVLPAPSVATSTPSATSTVGEVATSTPSSTSTVPESAIGATSTATSTP